MNGAYKSTIAYLLRRGIFSEKDSNFAVLGFRVGVIVSSLCVCVYIYFWQAPIVMPALFDTKQTIACEVTRHKTFQFWTAPCYNIKTHQGTWQHFRHVFAVFSGRTLSSKKSKHAETIYTHGDKENIFKHPIHPLFVMDHNPKNTCMCGGETAEPQIKDNVEKKKRHHTTFMQLSDTSRLWDRNDGIPVHAPRHHVPTNWNVQQLLTTNILSP